MANKLPLLADLLAEAALERTLVFTRTKHGADKVVRGLAKPGVNAAAIHGNKSQPQRERALQGFKSGKVGVLVATDIAARGIDIDAVSHVINYDLPYVPESYVHRIGRTARAGAAGRRSPSARPRSVRSCATSSAPSAWRCRSWCENSHSVRPWRASACRRGRRCSSRIARQDPQATGATATIAGKPRPSPAPKAESRPVVDAGARPHRSAGR